MRSGSTVLLATVLALLTGCDRPPSTPANAAAVKAPAAQVDAGDARALPVLALSEHGLDLVDADTGAIRHLAFGQPLEDVLAYLARLRGDPAQRGVNTDCGAGALDIATWNDGLAVLGQDGRFAGWSLDGAGAQGSSGSDLTTVGGIGLGSTRRALESLHAVQVGESSLGTEFAAGDLYGLLASDAADAAIVHLWAGTSCIFR